MPLRFRKSFKVAPGVKLNLSKSGISTSVGKRGATVNFSKRGTRATVGLPGTGLSYSTSTKSSSSPTPTSKPKPLPQTPPPSNSGSSGNKSNSGCLGFILFPFQILVQLIGSVLDPKTRKSTLVLLGSVIVVTCGGIGLVNATGGGDSSATPTAVDINAIATNAMMKAISGYTQTAAAIPTLTYTPTIEPTIASPTPYTPAPTFTRLPTFTPLPTITPIPLLPTSSHPSGTSGRCNDGTYTSAQHKQGACSHHGGVASWWGP